MSFLDEENMSSLIFYTDEAQALIVTDTLAVTDDLDPPFPDSFCILS